MRLVNLFAILLLTLLNEGCLSTPGLVEPVVLTCTLITDKEGDCTINGGPDSVQTKTIIDMIGYICVPPHGFADVSNHHEALHFELNKKLKGQ